MSIYQKVMGEAFYQLHPMLQKRYTFLDGSSFTGTGFMDEITGGPKWLYPFIRLGVCWKLLFPEHGKSIPFKIVNTPIHGKNGEEQIHWERIFYFGRKKRYFNALMSLDAKRNRIKDYLGEPPLFYSDLTLSATSEGYLQITSERQRLVLGLLEIPLPRIFQGLATVTEKYDEEADIFSIKVVVRNPLIGIIFSYEGAFMSNDIS